MELFAQSCPSNSDVESSCLLTDRFLIFGNQELQLRCLKQPELSVFFYLRKCIDLKILFRFLQEFFQSVDYLSSVQGFPLAVNSYLVKYLEDWVHGWLHYCFQPREVILSAEKDIAVLQASVRLSEKHHVALFYHREKRPNLSSSKYVERTLQIFLRLLFEKLDQLKSSCVKFSVFFIHVLLVVDLFFLNYLLVDNVSCLAFTHLRVPQNFFDSTLN